MCIYIYIYICMYKYFYIYISMQNGLGQTLEECNVLIWLEHK